MDNQDTSPKKSSLWNFWKNLKISTLILEIIVHLFALAGIAIVGAWALYKTGITNDAGSIDKNNRYLADYHAKYQSDDTTSAFESSLQNYVSLTLLSKIYPRNAELIYHASTDVNDPNTVDRMLYALNLYLKDDQEGQKYQRMLDDMQAAIAHHNPKPSNLNAIPWMNDSGWVVLKKALIRDADVINQAAQMTGVDARLIAACTVGEQIRLFNSKREGYKRYLGPAILSVGTQLSFGVNGIKLFTAERVEANLKDKNSPYYMGEKYETLLDFQSEDVEDERIKRLTNTNNHLYSFLYTGCILRQTMLQWQRAGYDISDRPDILCTLFNLGFIASKPNENPRCGGSCISVNNVEYTFGVVGNDFFYSGELQDYFPIHPTYFEQ